MYGNALASGFSIGPCFDQSDPSIEGDAAAGDDFGAALPSMSISRSAERASIAVT